MAGLQHYPQCLSHHRHGEADVPRDRASLSVEARHRVRAVTQADTPHCHRHPHVLRGRLPPQSVPTCEGGRTETVPGETNG